MFPEFLTNINWIDILMGCILARVIYISIKNGFITEFFKLLGILLATFLSLHFYVRLGDFFHAKLWMSRDFGNMVAYLILWILTVVVMKFVHDGWTLIFKTQAVPSIDKWGGFILGITRGLLICGLVYTLLFLTRNPYFGKKAKDSFLGFYLVDLSPNVYSGFFDGFIGKFFPDERKNNDVFLLTDIKEKSKRK